MYTCCFGFASAPNSATALFPWTRASSSSGGPSNGTSLDSGSSSRTPDSASFGIRGGCPSSSPSMSHSANANLPGLMWSWIFSIVSRRRSNRNAGISFGKHSSSRNGTLLLFILNSTIWQSGLTDKGLLSFPQTKSYPSSIHLDQRTMPEVNSSEHMQCWWSPGHLLLKVSGCLLLHEHDRALLRNSFHLWCLGQFRRL